MRMSHDVVEFDDRGNAFPAATAAAGRVPPARDDTGWDVVPGAGPAGLR